MAYISIDFDAYKHNLELLGKKVGDISKVAVVLKDNAYGHGLEVMSPLAAACGVKNAVVKNTKEALKIASFFEKVLVLIEANPQNAVVDDKIIYSVDETYALGKFPKNTQIHIKIDTGMRRNGVVLSELESVFKLAKENGLRLRGAFTHFYSSDMAGEDFYAQLKEYKKAKNICKELAKKYDFSPFYFHSRNSAAILRIDEDFDDDFVRAGISSYGYTTLDESFDSVDLRPVLSLYAQRFSTREVKKGEKIGYGGVFSAPNDMIVSSYDIGYGDGFFRVDGVKKIHIQNKKEILGRLSMDCMSIEGDDSEICVFDDVSEIAKSFNTIPYEVLTMLSPSIKRVVKPITK